MGTTPAEPMPPQFAGLWRDADGRLHLEFAFDPDGTPRVTVWAPGGRLHVLEAKGTWVPHTDVQSLNATTRLDHLRVELGSEGLGSTLHVLFCVEQVEPVPGMPALQWITAPRDTPRAEVRIHLDQGGSFYRVAMDPWDELLQDIEDGEGGWLRPFALVLPLFGEVAEAVGAARPDRAPDWDGHRPRARRKD